MPKVSICLPTYNNPDLVQRALNSVIDQDYLDYEIVITDDSEDAIIEELVSNISDKRLRYHKNSKKLGSPENWNHAVSLAKGEYIKILHHDDWFPTENCLHQFVKLLDDHPNSIMGFSASQACRSNGLIDFVHAPSLKQLESLRRIPSSLFFNNFIGAPSATIFRKVNCVSFDKSLKWVVDIDFYIQLLNCPSKNYSYTDQPLICVTIEGDHQVTNECVGNEEVEPFEYVLLFNKIKQITPKPQLYQFVVFFTILFSRFSLYSTTKLRRLAKIYKIPIALRLALLGARGLIYYRSGKKWINSHLFSLRG